MILKRGKKGFGLNGETVFHCLRYIEGSSAFRLPQLADITTAGSRYANALQSATLGKPVIDPCHVRNSYWGLPTDSVAFWVCSHHSLPFSARTSGLLKQSRGRSVDIW